MKRALANIVFVLFFISFSFVAGAQTSLTSQDDLKKKADEYFKNENYSAAMPLYSELVSIYPKDPLYNYRFGVSILFADRRITEKPLKYLLFAATKSDVDISVNYYLGMAYHNNYRFADAITKYNIYKKEAASKTTQKLKIDRQIEICNNAKELLTHFTSLYVLKKTEVNYKDFFRSYDLASAGGGSMLVKPDMFKTPLDKKKEKLGLMFYSGETREAYYSSYGKDGKTGKDIYRVRKLMNGTWSKPENLGLVINTAYDEDFPYMSPDSILYFSSKGGNTIGGYDIFSSKMNEDGTWSTPVNLNFPINTPFDDVMFVPDSTKQYAYFASDRSSLEGMITVYKVRIDKRIPLSEKINFDNEDSDSAKAAAANEQTAQLLKENASLDVNANESMFKENVVANNSNTKNNTSNSTANITNADNKTKVNGIDSLKKVDELNNDSIIAMAERQANIARDELRGYKAQKDAANKIAKSRKQLADAKYQEAATIKTKAESIKDDSTKQSEIAKANVIQSEADQLNRESEIATQIADDLKEKVRVKQKESDDAKQYETDIKKAVSSNSTDTSTALLTKMIEKLNSTPVDTDYIASTNPSKGFISEKENEADDNIKDARQHQEEVNLLKTQADGYRKDAANSKKKSNKEEFLKKATEIDKQVKTEQAQVDSTLQKAELLKAQADSARSQSVIYANVVDDIKNNNTSNQSKVKNTNVPNNGNNQTIANNTAVSNKTTNQTLASNTNTPNNTGSQTIPNNNAVSNKTTTPTTNQTLASNTNTSNNTGSQTTPNNTAVSNKTTTPTTNQTLASNTNTQNNTGSQITTNNNTVPNTNKTTTNNTSLNNQSSATQKQLTPEEQKIKKDIQTSTVAIVNNVQKAADTLKMFSDNAYAIADNKNKQSIAKQNEANKLITEANKITNADEKKKTLEKADELQKQSVDLAREAVISYKTAKQLDDTYTEKKQEIADINKTMKEIKLLVDSNNIADAGVKYTALQKSVAITTNVNRATNEYLVNVSNELDSKENELQDAKDVESRNQAIADSLAEKATILKGQANKATKQSTKKDLQNKATLADKQAGIAQTKVDSSIAKTEKLTIEVSALKLKIKYSTSLMSEISDNKTTPAAATNINKTELEKSINQYENNKIFTDVATSYNNVTAPNNNNQFTRSDTATHKQLAIASNTKPNNNTVVQNNSTAISNNNSVTANHDTLPHNNNAVTANNTQITPNNTADNTTTPVQTNAVHEKVKADLIDKTVVAINNNITVLQTNLNTEKDPGKRTEIAKQITDLQKESNTLKKESIVSHQLAAKLNDTSEASNAANTDDTTLVQNMENDASNYNDNSSQKRSDANDSTDPIEKAKLNKEAGALEDTAKVLHMQALELTAIVNQNKYYTNNIRLAGIRTIDDKNPQVTMAALLETEAKTYFEKGQKLQDSISDKMTNAQKKSLLEGAKENGMLAIQKQTKAIDIYSKVAPSLVSNTNKVTNQNVNTPNNTISNNNSTDKNPANNTTVGNKTTNNTTPNNTNTSNKTTNNSTPNNTTAGNKTGNNTTANNTTAGNNTSNNTTANNNTANNTNNNTSTNKTTSNNTTPANNTTAGNTTSDNKTDAKIYAPTNGAAVITTTEFKGIYISQFKSAPLNVDSANLIPLDPELPGSVVFKVQICAVRKHCAPDIFKGVTPLVGESTPTGLIRYMAGLFAKFDDAITSRDVLRTMGYNDAFIVAYYKGKRISVAEALALMKTDNTVSTTYADLNNKTFVSTGSANIVTPVVVNKAATTGLSNPVANIKGLFYTVQVGVYVRPVTSAQLFDITPLYDEYMTNGYIRYLSGVYSTLQDAVTAKNTIVVKGVKDAFVVVYNDGKKITLAEAKTLLSNNSPVANTGNTATNTTTAQNTSTINKTAVVIPKDSTINTVAIDKSGIVFKVQLGAYKNDVPVDIVNKFLDVVTDGSLQHSKDNDGLTTYTSGNFTDYKSANDYKSLLVSKGITDAFVIAFQKGVKISIAKAIELLK